MLHLRLVVPDHVQPAVLSALQGHPSVCHVMATGQRVSRPDGVLVTCEIPPESANGLLAALRELGLADHGAITMIRLDSVMSRHAAEAAILAPGASEEAVIWDEVEARLGVEAHRTMTYLAMMVIATLLAAVAVLTDSLVLVVGAMVVGPEFGPLAALTLALAKHRWGLARAATTTLVVGFALGMAAAAVLTAVLRAGDWIPGVYLREGDHLTQFISHPDGFSVLVALLAGAAGMLSLVQGRSGALVGVLISVTTIPAAANTAVAAALGRGTEAAGALAQLGVNLGCMLAIGLVTLRVVDLIGRRRRTDAAGGLLDRR